MNKIDTFTGCTLFPIVINIELTDQCPLHCPYCYKKLEMVNKLDFSFLSKVLKEFSAKGGRYVLLSGGEPLLYPQLIDAIRLCKKLNLRTAISTSGFGIDKNSLDNLFKGGLGSLFISLNSHIQNVNSLSRDGYEFAINAMKLCQKLQVPYKINSVIRHDNIDYFPELIDFAKALGASGIDLLSNKPNSRGILESPLDDSDLIKLVYIFNENKDYLSYQTCFTQLNAYFNKISGNRNLNPFLKGCSAGKYSMAMFSNGLYAPCPHIFQGEEFPTIYSYWKNSENLTKYRKVGVLHDRGCINCSYEDYCSPCLAFPIHSDCVLKFRGSDEKYETVHI